MDGIQKKKHHAKRTHLALKKQHHESLRDHYSSPKPTHTEEPAPKHYSKVLMEWDPSEFREHHRTENWFLWLGIVAAIFITLAIFLKAYIVAVTFFLLALVIVMTVQKPAKRIDFKITDTGIVIDDLFYPYHQLDSFWILYDPPHVMKLHFRRKERLRFDLHVEIEDQDPVAIRDLLLEYIEEKEDVEEPVIDAIARRLRF